MGEIADAIINGDFDYVTGEYLGNGPGFPRSYSKSGNYSSFKPEIGRINDILRTWGFSNKRNSTQRIQFLRQFMQTKNPNHSKRHGYGRMCLTIVDKYLPEFKKYAKEHKKN